MIVGNGYGKYGFDAYGDKVLKAEHMAFWMDNPQRTDPKGISFQLGKEIEEVEKDFFMLVPTIKELFILNPQCSIAMTAETEELFKKNKVLIRGEFDSNAEQYAQKYGLRFLHTDVELAYAGEYYKPWGIDTITLRFKQNGNAYIHYNNCCQGSSAGWSGGGELTYDLPKNFHTTMDAAKIADEYSCSSCQEAVKTNGILSTLLEKAKIKGGFLIDYSK